MMIMTKKLMIGLQELLYDYSINEFYFFLFLYLI